MPIHSITQVNSDRKINLFMNFTKLISSRLLPHTNWDFTYNNNKSDNLWVNGVFMRDLNIVIQGLNIKI